MCVFIALENSVYAFISSTEHRKRFHGRQWTNWFSANDAIFFLLERQVHRRCVCMNIAGDGNFVIVFNSQDFIRTRLGRVFDSIKSILIFFSVILFTCGNGRVFLFPVKNMKYHKLVKLRSTRQRYRTHTTHESVTHLKRMTEWTERSLNSKHTHTHTDRADRINPLVNARNDVNAFRCG